MYTWNFQYISKAKLAETFNQLMLNQSKGEILIRIHTAIHNEEAAVDLARFIKVLVPQAQILGTSTSAVINWGKLVKNQCVISVTQMSFGRIKTAFLPTFEENTDIPLPPSVLCKNVRKAVIEEDTKLLLTFLTGKYLDVYRFVERCNDYFPGVQMIGGLVNRGEINIDRLRDNGFIFNENGWSDKGIILAAISGERVESFSSFSAGVQVIGEEIEINDAFGPCILELNGEDAAQEYYVGIGEDLKERPELSLLFPFVYSDVCEIPIFVEYVTDTTFEEVFPEEKTVNERAYQQHPKLDRTVRRDMIMANHNVQVGKKLRRAFIYDGKIIADNHALFQKIESFEKAETLFGYCCIARAMIYSNCVKWELSAYENSNLCGCITEGEIAVVNGKNTFANGSFVISVIGEEAATQEYNPYAFSHTDSLVSDNRELLDYLMNIERRFEENQKSVVADTLKAFVRECEMKILFSENEDIPNAAALNMDIKLKGYDRICMINVTDIASMRTVFSDQMIRLTYKNYISKCYSYAQKKHYRMYIIDEWHIAIGAPSYMVSLSQFISHMEVLQRELFEASEEYIAIVPLFCVIDDCTVENIMSTYYSARVEMTQKNIQFYVRNASLEQLDEESIRRRYHMVNVINYAIAHDKVIPYFQGIYDNKTKKIYHYESLMRLEDENGKIYYPGEFLDVARSYGLLYDSISSIMVKKVFEKFKHCSDKSVSINLGLRDIKNRELVEQIYDFLSTAPYPGNFVFEILENEDIDDYDKLLNFVDRIHDLGGKISIDDFGSGYSNLQHIANIHSDYLKIDGSIVKRCCEDPEQEKLIALISGWKDLSEKEIRVIAEFVENAEIQKRLLKYDIDYSQGYLFSKPEPDIEV